MKRRIIAALAGIVLILTPAAAMGASDAPSARPGGFGDWPV